MDAVAGEVCCRFRPADAGANSRSRVIERRAASRLRELHLRQRPRLPPITRPTVLRQRRLRRRSFVAGASKLASVDAVKEAVSALSTTDATGRRRRRATESAVQGGLVSPIVERFSSDQSSLSSIHCLLSLMSRFIGRPATLEDLSHSATASSSSPSKSTSLLTVVRSTAERLHRSSKRFCRRSLALEDRFKRPQDSSSILGGLQSTWVQVDDSHHTQDFSAVKATRFPKVEVGVWCRSYYLRSSSGEFDKLVRSRSPNDLCSQWWLS